MEFKRYGRFAVSKPIDVGTHSIGRTTRDITGEDYGYIVSHRYYGNTPYVKNGRWELTLTGLQSNNVEIEFEQFELEEESGRCYDYLLIDSRDKLCKKPTNPITVNVNSSTNQISFTFITDSVVNRRGFWLLYRGNFTLSL